MAQFNDPTQPVPRHEMDARLRTLDDFKKELENEQKYIRAIPGLIKSVEKHEDVLFSVTPSRYSGLVGLIVRANEEETTIRISKRFIRFFWVAVCGVASLLGTIFGMLYMLLKESGLWKHLLGG